MNTVKMVAAIIGILGIGLAAIAFPPWWQYSRCTVTAEGVVAKRTPTYCAIRVEGAGKYGGYGIFAIGYSKIRFIRLKRT